MGSHRAGRVVERSRCEQLSDTVDAVVQHRPTAADVRHLLAGDDDGSPV